MTDKVVITSATYDVIAPAYDEANRIPSEEFLEHQGAFVEQVSGRVADLGCGPGRDLVRFGHLDVVGVDRSPGMLAIARTRGSVVQGDLRQPPLGDGVCGAVWSSASLLHVPHEDVPATLAAWHRLLVPGGVLGLSTSLGEDDGWEVVPYAVPRGYERSDHERWFVHHDPDDLLALLREAGFTIRRTARRATHRDWLMVLATA